jgi:hypothetical protein
MIANIASDDALILPQHANPAGLNFEERQDRRDLVWINVTENPTAEWIARQVTKAFSDEAIGAGDPK